MMLARWSINARFGYKQDVIDAMHRWMRDIAPKVGLSGDRSRLLTGSVGALESTVQLEHVVEDLAELQKVWDQLGRLEAHKQWGRELEPHVVSGTSRWEILRLL
jgi:hypothetical protein